LTHLFENLVFARIWLHCMEYTLVSIDSHDCDDKVKMRGVWKLKGKKKERYN